MSAWRYIRKRLIIFIPLVVLLAGFPLIIIIIGILSMALLGVVGFMFTLYLYNFYFVLPAAIFGEGLFPSHEFGYDPSTTGILVASVFYGIISIPLALLICRVLEKRGIIKPDKS